MRVRQHGRWVGWSSIGVEWGSMECGWDSMGVNANSSNANVANTEGCQFLYGLANPVNASLVQCQYKPLPMLLMLNTNAGNDNTTNASNSKLCPA